MRSHEKKNLTNFGNFEYQNEHVDSARLDNSRFPWGKAQKLSTLVLLSTPVRRIVYRPLFNLSSTECKNHECFVFPPLLRTLFLASQSRRKATFITFLFHDLASIALRMRLIQERGGNQKGRWISNLMILVLLEELGVICPKLNKRGKLFCGGG